MSFAFGTTGGGAFGGGGTGAFGGGGTAFGAAPAATGAAASPFGGGATTGGFGAAAAPSAFGGGGGFGSAIKPAATGFGTGGGFGATTTTGGGMFGAQPAATSAFGAPAATGGMFGGAAASPAGGFGAASPTTGFGAAANPTGGFGGASAFGGTTSAFGAAPTTSAFGAGAAASPFGAPKPAAASPFGQTSAFGAAQPQQSAFGATSAFGTPAPAAGGGMFGSGGATSAFGAKSPSPFGGATGGAFGAPAAPAAGGFGGGFGASPAVPQQPQVGTGAPPYEVTREADGAGMTSFLAISRMPAYAHKSLEELRHEDYLKRTNPQEAAAVAALNPPQAAAPAAPAQQGFGFGATNTGFGASPAASTGFGSSFGSTATTASTGSFGGFSSQPSTGGSLFGSTTRSIGGFGTTQTQPTSTFGAPTTQTTGAFGAPAAGGFGTGTSAFGGGFGAPATQPAAGGFGGFGSQNAATSTGFGATSAFGKPTTTTGGFGFNTQQQPAAATGGFGGFGQAAAAQPAAGGSLFGGTNTAGGSSFSFNSTPKPAASTGFGSFGSNTATTTGSFGSGGFGTTTGGFGATGGGFGSGGGFGAATSGGFGATTTTQPAAGGSLFGGTGTTGGFGGFNTGGQTTQAGAGTSLFGNTQKTGTSLFGNTTGTTGTTGGGLFGSTSTGGSLFGNTATAAKPAGGFSFGGGGALGGTTATTGGFGGFGSFGSGGATTGTTTGGFGGGGLFGSAPAQQAGAATQAPQQPASLVATPDVNPYGSGAFGAGLVEQNVKAALDLQSLKPSSSNISRLNTFAQDVGLPRGPSENTITTKRNLLSSTRLSIPVSFIREAGFKGSKSRFSPITSTASNGGGNALRTASGEQVSGGAPSDEFKFSSSLFRNSVAKRLIIHKSDQRGESAGINKSSGSRASVVPFADDEVPVNSQTKTLLKPDDEGCISVVFRTLSNKKSFTLRLKATDSTKHAREDVKRLLRTTMTSPVNDIQLLSNGRIVHDSVTVEGLNLREGDVIDVAIVDDLTDTPVKEASSSAPGKPTNASVETKTQPSRFMSYADFMNSAMREEQESVLSEGLKPASAACPSLKNPDYFTVPSYDRLKRMTDDELSAVENFTVGCRGLGSVEWIGRIDVRYLDLDELIHFETKEVIVYKDDENKHELGTGLNRPAIVELHGIFPPRKAQHDPESYKEKVKQRTRDIGSTYLDYSPATGIWRFRVEHFSRYGFDDDDDDEDMEKDAAHISLKAAGFGDEKKLLSMAVPKCPAHVATPKMLVPSDRIHLVRNSTLYGANSQSVSSLRQEAGFAVEDASRMSVIPLEPEPESSDNGKDDEHDDTLHDVVAEVPTSIVFPVSADVLQLQPLGIDCETSLLPRASKSTTYQMFLQVTSQPTLAKNQSDPGLFLARSFRCSWGPNGELVNISGHSSQNVGRQVAIEYPLQERTTPVSLNKDALDLHFECCRPVVDDSIDDESDGVAVKSFALPTDDGVIECLRKYAVFAERLRTQDPTSKFYRRTALLWKLVQALWGQEHNVSQLSSSQFCPLAARDDPREIESMETYQMIDLRREAISKWFEDALAADVGSSEVGSASESGVLKLLCQHRVVEAAEMAMECGDFRLATLLSQAASYEGSDMRSLLADQLSQWSENGTLEFIEEDVIMIYSLLAGSVEVLTSHRESNVSWLMSLALFFWYKRGPATSLKTALSLYREAVSKHRAKAALSESDPTNSKDDVIMEVMKLYVEDAVSLCNVLSPTGFPLNDANEPPSHLDYELSWHLHSVLRAIGFKIDRKWESHLHQNYIRQLEGDGLWEQAIYVSLNIADPQERATTCHELVLRHAEVLKALAASKRVELCDKYNLPMEWIEEALAVAAVSKHQHKEEIAHWMAARDFEHAHDCLIRHVAPTCLFTGEKGVLRQLLVELEPYAAEIPEWDGCRSRYLVGGGLLLEYLRLEGQEGLDAGNEEQYLRRLMQLADVLSSATNKESSSESQSATTSDYNAIVARTALSSMVVTLLTQAIQLRAVVNASIAKDEESDENPVPAHLESDFLLGLSSFIHGHETKFVESYRSQHLLNLCASFVDWRS